MVQDTEEEEELVSDSTEGGIDQDLSSIGRKEDNFDPSVDRPMGNMAQGRRPGRPRTRLANSAPTSALIVAVKAVKKKMGGARPGAID